MIVFELICPDHHRFEGWFASANDFEAQNSRGLLTCPSCGQSKITKLLTAKIGKAEVAVDAPRAKNVPATQSQARPVSMPTPQQVQGMVDYLLANCENVGNQFADEARRIHREEAPARNIRGVATREETQELLDEGIPVMPLPVPPQGEWH